MDDFKIEKYKDEDKEIEVIISQEQNNLFMTIEQLAVLFEKDRSTISRKVRKIIAENKEECEKQCAFLHFANSDKPVSIYGMKIIEALAISFKSDKAKRLKEFLINHLNEEINYEPKIAVYSDGNVNISVDISPEEATVWLSQSQIAELFETSRENVTMHIRNILKDGELSGEGICKKSLHTGFWGASVHKDYLYTRPVRKESLHVGGIYKKSLYVVSGLREYETSLYSLDMILAVGYRVKSKRAMAFRRWASSILGQYLIRGYAINERRAAITEENYRSLVERVDRLDERVYKIEVLEKHRFIEDKIIFENEVFDSIILINRIVETAKSSIILIDPYADLRTLNSFKWKKNETKLSIICSSKRKISKADIDSFNAQYGNLSILNDDRYHDRYLILDKEVFYHLGSSINYLGKRLSQITLIIDEDIKDALLKRINELN